MTVDFRNTNTVWASVLVETLQRLGTRYAVVSPGSRSTPLAVALAAHPGIEVLPVLDERTAGFFALGIARQTGKPTVLVCTSGTAAANYYPAVVEAAESQTPLLVLTADRPPELRECRAGQAIDQVKLYGSYPNWQIELATPVAELGMLRYLRQTVVHAYQRSLFPVAGVVHVNVPLRDPLPPVSESGNAFSPVSVQYQLQEDFFANLPSHFPISGRFIPEAAAMSEIFDRWCQCDRGLIVVGGVQAANPRQYAMAVGKLAQSLGWAVLADGISPLRHYAADNPYLISTYDAILRSRERARELVPELVLQLGELPVSKTLRNWLAGVPHQRWVIDARDRNFDALHGQSIPLHTDVVSLSNYFCQYNQTAPFGAPTTYCQTWCRWEATMRQMLDGELAAVEEMVEPKAAWLLHRVLPPRTPVFVANSMPVRDWECFGPPNNLGIQPFFNRGANGIDGTLSAALGMAHRHLPGVLLTGDLALLHDTNGFLLHKQLSGHLTVVVINNQGGGIFEMLPISQFEPPFEQLFAMPQQVDLPQLCAAYGVAYEEIRSWSQFEAAFASLPVTGMRVLEVKCDRKRDRQWRQELWQRLVRR
ncbi:2-succinyl-5-enolpyruvyl-6-hydroxy-3-cyclohexene-1-carboxylic-acid synthase [Geitlerinema sp. PCC 9228]|jgi:2-succinyl-5-enolpyruvyl-6-hydroxy-3-cyclohexene-1-carboxylate synthase|uniref:2-succinyl-5-enolpyruvyl-6-hydroxy-3- cyclohexene-1-carboxylic-acid synthase n=1 Tax=Geitlerinema sp. PCC 9228 TaxID=111611 RepID=UPI0008F984EE|nr:2-succinyl-5-enolpyruvyl-6-hydroxy-3-cyclohexene-1-carboxylic-acid synthase [Geitlerinema sp. PCC 9228]